MKKILSKVLMAISIFNGVNVSTCAMEENTEQPVNIQTGVSNSWKEWAKNERKRITDIVDWMMQYEWKWRRYFRVDLQESNEKSDNIDKQVAHQTILGNVRFPELPQFLADYGKAKNDYEKKFEPMSLPYLFYGRGVCRNRAAWVLRVFLNSNIFARIVMIKDPDENDNRALNHVVVLYAMPDENRENKWNYYIADLMALRGGFNTALNDCKNPVLLLSEENKKICRDDYMQIPLKTYLNSKKYWCGVGFIVEFVYSEPNLDSVFMQIYEQIYSDYKNGVTEEQRRERNERLEYFQEVYQKYLQDRHRAKPFDLSIDCAQGEISKEDASKHGITDLKMWCKKNCPEVLE